MIYALVYLNFKCTNKSWVHRSQKLGHCSSKLTNEKKEEKKMLGSL